MHGVPPEYCICYRVTPLRSIHELLAVMEDTKEQLYKVKNRLLEGVSAAELFAPGDRVMHFIFGPGQILDIDAAKKAYLIQFDDMDTPRQVSCRAKLEKI